MKPSDCIDQYQTNQLNEIGLNINDYGITVGMGQVILNIHNHTNVKIPVKIFKKFSKWFLEDQGN